jgi:hypothetical protein
MNKLPGNLAEDIYAWADAKEREVSKPTTHKLGSIMYVNEVYVFKEDPSEKSLLRMISRPQHNTISSIQITPINYKLTQEEFDSILDLPDSLAKKYTIKSLGATYPTGDNERHLLAFYKNNGFYQPQPNEYKLIKDF